MRARVFRPVSAEMVRPRDLLVDDSGLLIVNEVTIKTGDVTVHYWGEAQVETPRTVGMDERHPRRSTLTFKRHELVHVAPDSTVTRSILAALVGGPGLLMLPDMTDAEAEALGEEVGEVLRSGQRPVTLGPPAAAVVERSDHCSLRLEFSPSPDVPGAIVAPLWDDWLLELAP